MTNKLKQCPDCKTKPIIRDRKNVYGLSCGILIECEKCQRFAYNEVQWNALVQQNKTT